MHSKNVAILPDKADKNLFDIASQLSLVYEQYKYENAFFGNSHCNNYEIKEIIQEKIKQFESYLNEKSLWSNLEDIITDEIWDLIEISRISRKPSFHKKANSFFKTLNRHYFENKQSIDSIQQALGYTTCDIIKHFENLLKPGMTMHNFGLYWNIGHIFPQNLLPFNSIDDVNFKLCWRLENLEPQRMSQNTHYADNYFEYYYDKNSGQIIFEAKSASHENATRCK